MSKSKTASDQRTLLLRLIDEAFDKEAWLGPNLRGSIRRVKADQAVWRPRPGRRNIAEIAVHCAYWKYAVRRRTTGEKRGSFPLKGSNWFPIPPRITDKQWKDYISLLDDTHKALRETLATAVWPKLTAGPGGSSKNLAAQVYGIAMHDTYHTGQIRTIRALYKHATGG